MYNEIMLSTQRGFTLIELLVVIAIMVITSVFTLANYRSFGDDQNFKNAALDVQSFLRLAQANATSSLKCQDNSNNGWLVTFAMPRNLDLKCQYLSGTETIITGSLKNYSLPSNPDISIQNIMAGSCTVTQVIFAPLYGTMTSNCGSNQITITLKNSKRQIKQIKIDPGGRIYEP